MPDQSRVSEQIALHALRSTLDEIIKLYKVDLHASPTMGTNYHGL
jgi:hypothetical protein